MSRVGAKTIVSLCKPRARHPSVVSRIPGLRVLFTGEGGETWLLVAGLAWFLAALRFEWPRCRWTRTTLGHGETSGLA